MTLESMGTLKNSSVVPEPTAPYLMCVLRESSSTSLKGRLLFSTVRKAARLAVYDETTMSVKNHQAELSALPLADLQRKRSALSFAAHQDGKKVKRTHATALDML